MPVSLARGIVAALFVAVPLTVSARARGDGPCAGAYEQTQLLRQNGKLVEAREAARACARTTCPEVARKDCVAWGEQLGAEVPSVIVIARDEATGDEGGVRVQVDGVSRPEASGGRAFELDPGAHVFRVERAGDEPLEQTITLVRGERDRALRFLLRSVAPPPPAPAAPPERVVRRGSLLPAAIVGAASVATLGVSAWLGLTGRSELSNLRVTCAPVCTDAQVDPVRRRLLASDITLGAGIVGAGITIYLFAHALSRGAEAQVGVAPGAGGASFVLRARF
jgi:hypothetical protein